MNATHDFLDAVYCDVRSIPSSRRATSHKQNSMSPRSTAFRPSSPEQRGQHRDAVHRRRDARAQSGQHTVGPQHLACAGTSRPASLRGQITGFAHEPAGSIAQVLPTGMSSCSESRLPFTTPRISVRTSSSILAPSPSS
ncbi:hypothetical protein HMPREF1549_02630 [Actinomyces johnsonii F0510]|uniref:Uncharacterized protein n=1 Tax=Actinomyces johnsonii F0510 TaxID=1227262 RepID=U1R8S1_9ACTO|nr:hypothetical protein HMPREF1549_02630 [Actinomyces johnsonii F0510]